MKSTVRTIITSAFTALMTFCAVVYISCTKDRCASVSCKNGGSCNGGKCTCTGSYEGDNCEKEARTKFIGNWGVENNVTTTEPASYGIQIVAGAANNEVQIKNLHDIASITLVATISRDSITIPVQTISGKTFVGAGYIYSTSVYGQNNTVSVHYTVTDNTAKTVHNETEIWHG